ncbi:MAG: Hsp70 family protein [Deltaproteobacteria bacterium]|nr:Hsp70 family protein [Deltaproteobacteria bacterium]MCW5806638.1 Hsp70 family protein [Deltaproteobacteria bacterium]
MAETQQPLYVGIDLGTTNSAAAVFDGERVSVVRNAQGSSVTPSVVRLDKQGRVTVGTRARRFIEQDAANTATEFKRLMGTGKPIEFPGAGATRKPEELSAEVLKALRQDIADQLGVAVERAVISVPALFELPQSAATSEAARLAGFERVELLQEPIASALAAGWRAEDDGAGTWLVFDLGGGTFDASLLETRDGLLRVVGHDGDNFLGGRDFDLAITEHLASRLSVVPRRNNADHTAALRALRLAAEDAKIELSRGDRAQVSLAQPLVVDGEEVEVDLELDRATVERLCAPLVDRAVDVCVRLLTAHGLGHGRLSRIVLVGGPTVMPMVRARVAARLEAPIAEGHDPMTLVAQGAALYAATAGLDGRAQAQAAPTGRQVWLQYPAVSADLTPHVVGKFVANPAGDGGIAKVTLARADGGWASAEATVGPDGTWLTSVTLLPRRACTFTLDARTAAGESVPVTPPALTIVQGLTIGDPPLSRTLGVALANGHVQVYLERGAPLPARRTFTHHTIETVAKGSSESVLRIPIVQGETSQAHLCRLVGTLDIGGDGVVDTVPTGTAVEVTIELDRGGRLSARALVPTIGQVFEHVAHLLVPDAAPDALDAALRDLRRQLMDLRTDAFRHGLGQVIEKLDRLEARLSEAERDIDAAHGGDADAAQRARRALLEIDGTMAEADLARKWPELDAEARHAAIAASATVGMHGTDAERSLLQDVLAAMDKARRDKDAAELERQMRLATRLSSAAYNRTSEAWEWYFEVAASEVSKMRDLPKAQRLVTEGKTAIDDGNTDELRRIVKALWNLLPEDSEARKKGFDSGVR